MRIRFLVFTLSLTKHYLFCSQSEAYFGLKYFFVTSVGR